MAPCDAMAEIRRLEAEIERYKRAVEWCLENGAKQTPRHGTHRVCTISGAAVPVDVPDSIADIISPAAGRDGNG